MQESEKVSVTPGNYNCFKYFEGVRVPNSEVSRQTVNKFYWQIYGHVLACSAAAHGCPENCELRVLWNNLNTSRQPQFQEGFL